jgi:hypothetical protein
VATNPDVRFHKWALTAIAWVVGAVVAVVLASLLFEVEFEVVAPAMNFFLTVALVAVTTLYVRVTQELAREAARSNDRAAQDAELARQMAAPVLSDVDGIHIDEQPNCSIILWMNVRNSGSGVATEIEVLIDESDEPLRFAAAVGWHDDPVRLHTLITSAPLLPPDIVEWRFTDVSGRRYRQPHRGRPEMLGS